MTEQATVNLTRRQVLTGVGLGVGVLAATNLATAYTANESGRASMSDELAAFQNQVAALQSEAERLRGLVTLYGNLEKVGVDALIAAGLSAIEQLLEALRGGVKIVREGIGTVGAALDGVSVSFDILRDGLKLVEQWVGDLEAAVKKAEEFLNAVVAPAQPFFQAVQNFFADLLDKIPFGIGANIKNALDALIALINAIPTFLNNVKIYFLGPLRATWFSPTPEKDVQGALFKPLRQNLLDPAKKFLDDADTLLARWETDLATPVKAALADRQKIRDQIAQYRQAQGL
jgi:hypothetical protein